MFVSFLHFTSSQNCAAVEELIKRDPTTNTTRLTTAIGEAYATWTRADKANFAPYKKRVETLLWNDALTPAQKLNQTVAVIDGFMPDGAGGDYCSSLSSSTPRAPSATTTITSATTPTTTPSCGQKNVTSCDDGWTPFGGSCYRFVGSGYNFTEGQQLCRDLNATLPSVNRAEENQFITDFSDLFITEDEKCMERAVELGTEEGSMPYTCLLWLGYSFAISNTTWTDGTPINYTNWAPGEPVRSPTEICVQLFNREGDGSAWAGEWNDEECWRPQQVICEKKARVVRSCCD